MTEMDKATEKEPMSWTEPRLVEMDAHTITCIDVARDDLAESADYLKWVFRSRKRRNETFETHEMFFLALIEELDSCVALLEAIRPPTEKYSLRPLKRGR
jgi:hypothetical protein